jgi:Cytochrome c3
MRALGNIQRTVLALGMALALLAFASVSARAQASAPAPAKNTCLECHSALDEPLHVDPNRWAQGIHAQKGLTCTSCHGGDATSDDPERAMSRAAGFRGALSRKQIPELCGGCHANAAYMRGFNPSLRTDQLSEYKTSIHGQRLAKGDTKVAVCIDCHGLHGIREVNDSRAPVYPLNVAKTCAHCHADPAYMKGYGIPTNQYAEYTASVHDHALTVEGDLSAPTCNTCHGNHGAAPPGISSIASVCGTCHAFQEQQFDQSPHKEVFATTGQPACVVCHSNHRILHPTDAMIGVGKESVCVRCHSEGEPGYQAAARIRGELDQLTSAIQRSDQILGVAERSGMEVGDAKLEEAQARDDLIKARVTLHSADPAKVETDVQEGLKVTQKTYEAGMAALAERAYRRKGLAFALLAIVAVLAGLWVLIRRLESGGAAGKS